MSYKRFFALLLILFVCIFHTALTCAAEDEIYAEYVIEEGDFLSVISLMFNTTVDDILAINPGLDVNAISIGTRVKIPTLAGIEGTISTKYLNIGDTLASLSILSGMNEDKLAEINDFFSPTELYIGSLLTTIFNPSAANITAIGSFDKEKTLIEKSIIGQTNPELLRLTNRADGSWDFSDKQILYTHSQDANNAGNVHTVSELLDAVEIHPLPLVQGETFVVHLNSPFELNISGHIDNQDLHFYKDEGTNDWYAMVGIDAMANPGLTSFALSGNTPDGRIFSIDQPIVLEAGIFTNEVVEGVDSSTLDPVNQQKDTDLVKSLTTSKSNRSWGERLSYPVDEPCFASGFGSRRSYNDGSFYNYHSGIDYSVCLADNINIYAAADGVVVFAEELPIHGNYTVIDHGWGVFTTYSHQAQITVSKGQTVKRGELIGLIGNTGRSVGPHLHLEVIINGVYVNALTWLSTTFP